MLGSLHSVRNTRVPLAVPLGERLFEFCFVDCKRLQVYDKLEITKINIAKHIPPVPFVPGEALRDFHARLQRLF
jgi:hypothetical protein